MANAPMEKLKQGRFPYRYLLPLLVTVLVLPSTPLHSAPEGKQLPPERTVKPTEAQDPTPSGTAGNQSNSNRPKTQNRQIQSGDKLRIEVGGEDWGGRYRIPPNGEIDFRFIGELRVVGRTKNELQSILTRKLSGYYRRPEVVINFEEIAKPERTPPIYFGGHVTKKGPINPGGPISFSRALTLVDGFAKTANPDEIRILKKDNQVKTINGNKQQDPSEWEEIQPFMLEPGDYVYVPGKKTKETPDEIYFAGAVREPGVGQLDRPESFGVAMAKNSQTLSPDADESNVWITRPSGDTAIVDAQRQLKNAQLSPEQRFIVRPGDYIYVPEDITEQIKVTVLGEVGRPQEVQLPKGAGIMDAIVKAGSITRHSDRMKTMLFRVDDGDTITKTASYSKFVNGDLSQNIPLNNRDVVYVRTEFWPHFDTLREVLRTIGYVTGTAVNFDRIRDVANEDD